MCSTSASAGGSDSINGGRRGREREDGCSTGCGGQSFGRCCERRRSGDHAFQEVTTPSRYFLRFGHGFFPLVATSSVEQASAFEVILAKTNSHRLKPCSTKPLKSFTVRTARYDYLRLNAIFVLGYRGLGRLAANTQISATTDSAAAV